MKKIVVADDEVRIRMLYNEVLSGMGYEVHSAKDGAEAWYQFQQHQPDLVILDVKMPDMHGFEVLEKIREKDPEVPVLICSAYPKLGSDPALLTMGIVGFINKPIDISTLRSEVIRVIGPDETGEATPAGSSEPEGHASN